MHSRTPLEKQLFLPLRDCRYQHCKSHLFSSSSQRTLEHFHTYFMLHTWYAYWTPVFCMCLHCLLSLSSSTSYNLSEHYLAYHWSNFYCDDHCQQSLFILFFSCFPSILSLSIPLPILIFAESFQKFHVECSSLFISSYFPLLWGNSAPHVSWSTLELEETCFNIETDTLWSQTQTMTIYKTMSALSDIFGLTASPNDVSVMIDMDVTISMSLRSSSHSQYSGDRGCPSSLMNLQVFIRQSIFNSLQTLSVQIHTRDASVTTVHLPIALNARCIVSSHLFCLSGSLRLLLFVLMCQLFVITRIFRLDFITVGEDGITYVWIKLYDDDFECEIWDTSRALRGRRCFVLVKCVLSTLNSQSLAFAALLDVWWHRVTKERFFFLKKKNHQSFLPKINHPMHCEIKSKVFLWQNCMTLSKYWYCFSHRRHRESRSSLQSDSSFFLCMSFFSFFLSNWTRCSSCITALPLLSCHDWVYVTFNHETLIQFRRGHQWNDPSFYYDTHTCFLNVRWTLRIFKSTLDQSLPQFHLPLSIEFVVASADTSVLSHLSYVSTCRTLRMSFQSTMQRVTHTRNI